VKGKGVLIISVGWDKVAFEPTSPSVKEELAEGRLKMKNEIIACTCPFGEAA